MRGRDLKVKFFDILIFDTKKLEKCLEFGNEKEVYRYFSDGRRLSFLLEIRLARILNAELAHPNKGYDLIVKSGKLQGKWEVRTLTERVYFSPSKDVGYGRATNKDSIDKKLSEINGYIIGDAYLFPSVPVFILYSSDLKCHIDGHTNSKGELESDILTKNYTITRSKFWKKLVYHSLSEKEIAKIIRLLEYDNAKNILNYFTKKDILNMTKKLDMSLKSGMKKNELIKALLDEIKLKT